MSLYELAIDPSRIAAGPRHPTCKTWHSLMFASIRNSLPYVRFKSTKKAIQRAIKLPRYLGSEHRCPICGVGLRAFKPIWRSYMRKTEQFGYVHRHAELETFNTKAFSCPKCDASDRDRLMAIFLDGILPSLTKSSSVRLVDFAPSDPLSKKIARTPSIEYRTADLYRNDVQDRIDLTDISYPDESTDIFICSHMFEHIPDDRKAMRELYRILKPGGFGLVLVPLAVGVDETHEDPTIVSDEHVRHYGRRDFVERLTAAGFVVDQLGIEYFGAETFRRAGIAANSILYVVRKEEVGGSATSVLLHADAPLVPSDTADATAQTR
jgi:SAM-dependent methyltransferase